MKLEDVYFIWERGCSKNANLLDSFFMLLDQSCSQVYRNDPEFFPITGEPNTRRLSLAAALRQRKSHLIYEGDLQTVVSQIHTAFLVASVSLRKVHRASLLINLDDEDTTTSVLSSLRAQVC